MRRAVPLAAIVLVLLAVACGTKASKNENAQDEANVSAAVANLRSSIPAIEAYYQDNNTYIGLTLTGLQQYRRWNQGYLDRQRRRANVLCRGDQRRLARFMNGPSGDIMLGSCSDPNGGKPYNPAPTEEFSSPSETVDAFSSLRASLPAIEAYYQDHTSYSGMTLSTLRQIDAGLPEIKIVSATKESYCVESTSGDSYASRNSPTGELQLSSGSCGDPGSGEPIDSSSDDDEYSAYLESLDAPTAIHVSIPAIEAYYQDNGTYSGMTVPKLRQIDYGLPQIKIVSAKKLSYCIEIEIKGSSAFTRGPCSTGW